MEIDILAVLQQADKALLVGKCVIAHSCLRLAITELTNERNQMKGIKMHERKYQIIDNKLVKRSNQVPVPDNEPLFIFRAKDRKALATLVAYNMILDNLDQKAEVTKSINDFRAYQEMNPDKMAEPSP